MSWKIKNERGRKIHPTGGLLKTLRRPQNTTCRAGPAAGDSPQPPACAGEP